MPNRKSHYVVEIELPRQLIEVHAWTDTDAVFKAWQMIGVAGVHHYGHIVVTRLAPPAPPAVTHTGATDKS